MTASGRCGIYQIRCSVSGKLYIGSSCAIDARWSRHRHGLRTGTHTTPRLQRAWIKHGEGAFAFSVIEYCEREHLLKREQFHIDRLRPDYNSMLKVRVITKEMRNKINATLAARAATVTHCPYGHAYSEDNTRKRGGIRICRACNARRSNAAHMTPENRARRLEQKKTYHAANRELNLQKMRQRYLKMKEQRC